MFEELLGKVVNAATKRKILSLVSGGGIVLSAADKNDETQLVVSGGFSEFPGARLFAKGYILPGKTSGSFDVSTQDALPTSVAFRNDGTRMYVVGNGFDSIYQYNLATPWDVSTAVFVSSFDVSAQDTVPTGVAFRDNGTRMYVSGASASDSVHQYDLTIPWDIATASFVSSFDVSAQDTSPNGVAFRDDGTRMYVVGSVSDSVHQYDLIVPWDVTTASFVSSFDVSAQAPTAQDLAISFDGTHMFVVGSSSDSVHRYDLTAAWDVSTSIFVSSFDVSSQDTFPTGIAFRDDGTRMYVVGSSSDSVHQYATNRLVLGV